MIPSEEYTFAADWFSRWWDPKALLDDVRSRTNALPGHIPGNLLFNNPALKPLREGYAAAKFALIRSQATPCMVRLVDPTCQFPDFEIRFGDEFEQFEIVEADRAGRRRGDEYREAECRAASSIPRAFRIYDPDEEIVAAIPAITAALELKARKHYQPQPHILVYVNFPTNNNGRPPLKDFEAYQLGKRFAARFPSIWFLWGDNAVRCWPNPANTPLRK